MYTLTQHLRRREADERGFTLIELIVVIIIIAILAAVAIPIFMNQEKAGHRAALESDVKNSAASVLDESKGTPSFNDLSVVETAKSGNTVVTADHPTAVGSYYMVYGYSEGAGGVEICFDSSTGKLGEDACIQPNPAKQAAEAGTPGDGGEESPTQTGWQICGTYPYYNGQEVFTWHAMAEQIAGGGPVTADTWLNGFGFDYDPATGSLIDWYLAEYQSSDDPVCQDEARRGYNDAANGVDDPMPAA